MADNNNDMIVNNDPILEDKKVLRQQKKAEYDLNYINNKRKTDEVFRKKLRDDAYKKYHENIDTRREYARNYAKKRKEEKYIEKHGSLEGFTYKSHNNN